jgi:hypothetical protein
MGKFIKNLSSVTIVGLDVAKNIFQVHGVDAGGALVGACATLCHRKGHNDALRIWADRLLARKTVKHKFKLTAVALANKVARVVFALMTRGGEYNELPIVA